MGGIALIGQGNASSSPSRFAVRGSPLGIGGSASSVRTDSKSLMRVGRRRDVHDLMSATVRSRAPILRVFVPCSSLSSRTAKRAGSAWEEGETEEEDEWVLFNDFTVAYISEDEALTFAGNWKVLGAPVMFDEVS